MGNTRQGARPASRAKITIKYNNRSLTEAKTVMDRLAQERMFVDVQTKVDIGIIYQELKKYSIPINEAVLDMLEEHGEGEEGNKKIKPGSPAERRFQKAHKEFMEVGEYTIEVKPIRLSSLKIKKRNEHGEREDELYDLSADEIIKLGELLVIDNVE